MKKSTEFKFKQGNLEEGLPFKDEQFDIVYAGEVIEHLVNPDFFLEEINRMLKTRGKLILSTPNLCAWFNRILLPLGIQPLFVETSTKSTLIGAGPLKKIKRTKDPVGHLRIFNKTAISDILHSQGFRILKMKGAVFDSGKPPKPLLLVDNFLKHFSSLCADFVILAQKKDAK